MKNKIFGLLVFMAISLTAGANGQINQAKVVDVRVDRSGNGIVTFDKPRTSEPAECGDVYDNSLSINTSQAGGKAILSVALSALATGKSVVVWGTGTCLEYPNYVESWSYGHIYQ